MSRTITSSEKASDLLDQSKWKKNEYGGGMSHPEYGALYFRFHDFNYCCGAQEMGGLRFDLRNRKKCLEWFKKYMLAYRRSLVLATVNKSQKKEKSFLLEAGFELLDNLKFKNQNTKNEVEVLCLRDRPFKKDTV